MNLVEPPGREALFREFQGHCLYFVRCWEPATRRLFKTMLCCILPPSSTWRLGIKKPQAIQNLENKDVRRLYRDWCCYYRRSFAVDCGSKQSVNFHHKTAFDIPGAKNVTLFSKILNCKFLVLCFVLCWSRCVMVSCTRKRKCDGQLGPCHIYAMFRRSCTHFYQWVWPCVHIKTIKNRVYEFDHNQYRGA